MNKSETISQAACRPVRVQTGGCKDVPWTCTKGVQYYGYSSYDSIPLNFFRKFHFAEDKPPSGKYCPFQFIYLNRLENVQKSQNCPDNPDILWTIQKLSRQSRNSHRTIQKLFGQSRICPDNPETVRTIQKLS